MGGKGRQIPVSARPAYLYCKQQQQTILSGKPNKKGHMLPDSISMKFPEEAETRNRLLAARTWAEKSHRARPFIYVFLGIWFLHGTGKISNIWYSDSCVIL